MGAPAAFSFIFYTKHPALPRAEVRRRNYIALRYVMPPDDVAGTNSRKWYNPISPSKGYIYRLRSLRKASRAHQADTLRR